MTESTTEHDDYKAESLRLRAMLENIVDAWCEDPSAILYPSRLNDAIQSAQVALELAVKP